MGNDIIVFMICFHVMQIRVKECLVYIVLCIDSFYNFETQNFENRNYMSGEIDLGFSIMTVLIHFDGLGVNMKRLPCWQVVKYGSKCAWYIQDTFRSLWECGRIKIMNIINFESIRKTRYITLVG